MNKMTSIPLIDLSAQYRQIRREVLAAVHAVFESQRFILGENVRELESAVAKDTGSRFAVGLASGTDALYLALIAGGIGAGDEVITAPFTFFATAGAISRAGAKPVFADIDPATYNLDPEAFKKKITRRTKAVIPVHLFGLPCQMDEIMKIARQASLFVLEDAAQSYGARHHGRPAGSIGDAGCFSFYPTKNLGGAGDGGMLVTSSQALAEKVRKLRDHGAAKKYRHELVGINSRLDEVQAAVLRVKLKHVHEWNRRRGVHAAAYRKAFRDLPLSLPWTPVGRTHTYHLYSVMTPRRDALSTFLKARKIGNGVYYALPLHLQPCYKNLKYRKGDFPVSERVAAQILSLPMDSELTRAAVTRVIQGVKEFFHS